jgi:hypothetical protein
MKLPRRKFLQLAAGAAALPAASRAAWAQAYPSRPVRIVVGFPPAGIADILPRLIGQWLSERLGQPFVVENRPGASSNIGTEAVVRATPDGYTLLLVTSANAINATLYEKLNFDIIRNIAPIASLVRVPLVMEINPSVPAIADVKTCKDQCTIWCRSHNLTAPYSVREFVAAAVACGVKYSPLENFPHDLAIGVAHYGRIVRGEWRAVLQNGPAEPVRR